MSEMTVYSLKNEIWPPMATCMRNAKPGDTTGFARLSAIMRRLKSWWKLKTQNISNMLGNGFAVPSLKTAIARAYQVLESPHSELGIESASQRRARMIQTQHGIERDFVAAPSAVDVSKAVQSIGLKFLEAGNDYPSKEDFQKKCCEALADFWIRRYGFDAFAPYAMSRAHLNPEAYRQRSLIARQQAIPQISELIQTAMNSPGGRLSKRKAKRSRPINHTSESLKEELI